jgi:3-oxoadipate enol-lactonase
MEFATISGVELAYRTAGSESATPVVLIHGYTGNHRNWALNFKPLLAAGCRTLSPDNPGHGASAAPEAFEPYELGEVAETLHQLAVGLDFEPAVIIGHSMGGAIAEEYAIRHPDAVSALVLVDSAGGSSGAEREAMAAHIDDLRNVYAEGGMDAVFEQQVTAGLRPGIETLTPALRELTKSEFAKTSWSGFEFGGLALRTRHDTLARLGAFTKPALIIVGENESPALKSVGEDLAASMPHADSAPSCEATHSPTKRVWRRVTWKT